MSHGILKPARLFSSMLLLALAMTALLIPVRAAADTTTIPSSKKTVTQYCANKTGTEQAACATGYDAGGAGNGHEDVNDACSAYPGGSTKPLQQLQYDCQSAWAYAANEDPATYCSPGTCDLIGDYVNPAIDLFSLSFGLIAVISIIMGGIQYTASQGDPQKTSAAKNRISKTMMAIFIYLFLYSFLQFLIPGGIFH